MVLPLTASDLSSRLISLRNRRLTRNLHHARDKDLYIEIE